jgi:hypothetical protein
MFMVTAIYQNGEIGYGEGEGLDYAVEDCAASIPSIFENETVTLSILTNYGETAKIDARVYLTIDGTVGVTAR